MPYTTLLVPQLTTMILTLCLQCQLMILQCAFGGSLKVLKFQRNRRCLVLLLMVSLDQLIIVIIVLQYYITFQYIS